jgi:type VI secretion system protein ImpE
MNAADLFRAGHLQQALESLNDEVRAKPTDMECRTLLFELLCFAGNLDRAEKQLDFIGQQDTQHEWAVQVYKNIIAAERTRRRLFADGLEPGFLLDPPDYVRRHLAALGQLRAGQPAEASALLAQADEQFPHLAGTVNGQAFDELRDCDDLLAPVFELIVLRDYIWLPLEHVRTLEIDAPERPRDLLWIPIRLVLSDNTQHRGYMPTLYCGSHEHPDERIKLGRMTDWKVVPEGPMQGLGHRTWLAGETDWPMLEVRQVLIHAGGAQ